MLQGPWKGIHRQYWWTSGTRNGLIPITKPIVMKTAYTSNIQVTSGKGNFGPKFGSVLKSSCYTLNVQNIQRNVVSLRQGAGTWVDFHSPRFPAYFKTSFTLSAVLYPTRQWHQNAPGSQPALKELQSFESSYHLTCVMKDALIGEPSLLLGG